MVVVAGSLQKLTVQKLQNCAPRIVPNSSYDVPSSTLLDRLKWSSINELITGETVTMVYKS